MGSPFAVPMDATLTVPKGNPALAKITPAEFSRIVSDPVYYVNEYCYTFDPLVRAKGHHLMRFRLYDFQEVEVMRIANAIRQGRDLFYEKSRDMGISWIVMAVSSFFWNFEDAFQAVYGSRIEDAVDNFQFDSLFGKADIILDKLPFQPKGFSKAKHRTKLKIVNPMNGNLMKGESSNPNWSRSGRYALGVLDEIAFWEDAAAAWGGAQDSCSCVIAVTTPSHKPGFAKALRNSGIVQVVTLHWRLHPLKDEAWYEQEKKERLPEDLAREVDINWEGAITGRYLPEVEHVRLGDFPYMPNWPLWVSHDFGYRPDPHAAGWFQVNPENGRFRLVESFEKNPPKVEWLMPFFGHPINSEFSYLDGERELIGKVKDWKKGTHVGDPAGKAGESTSGKSPIDVFADFDLYVNVNNKAVDYPSRRSGAARVLMNLDINDTPNNRYFLECIKNARLPDVPDGSQRTTENNKPIHDWTSHNRSMLEYLGVNVDWEPQVPDPQQRTFQKLMAEVQLRNRTGAYLGSRN